MDRRPKKHRLSDINRVNINLNKCISKVENAPSDYTIITAAGMGFIIVDILLRAFMNCIKSIHYY